MRHRKLASRRAAVAVRTSLPLVKAAVLCCVAIDEVAGAQKAREIAELAASKVEKIKGKSGRKLFLQRLKALGLHHSL